MSSKLDTLKKAYDDDKITVILIQNPEHRKIIHQFLDSGFYKISVAIECKPRELIHLRECWKCKKYVRVRSEDYRFGYLDNNQDERYSLECQNCLNCFSYEPYYDNWDDDKYVKSNNAIVIGKYIEKYERYPLNLKKIIGENPEKIIEKSEIFIFEKPEIKMNKKRFIEWLNNLFVKNIQVCI